MSEKTQKAIDKREQAKANKGKKESGGAKGKS